MKWPIVKVGEIAKQIRGVSYAKEQAKSAPGAGLKPILRANNITDVGLTFNDLVYVPDSCVSPLQIILTGDIIVAASSGSLAVVGKSGQAHSDFMGSFGAFCKLVRPSNLVDARFLGHFFKTDDYRRRISSLAEGANINNLRNEHIDDLEVPLPPIEEQRRIAAILDQAEALRAKRRQALAKLDTLTQAIFFEMFKGRNGENDVEMPLQNIVRKGTIVTYGIVQAGDEYKGGVPYIRTGDIKDGIIVSANLRHTDPAIAAKFSRSRVEAGDIVMSIRATVGTTAPVSAELEGANLTQGTARISPGDCANRSYLLAYLRSPEIQRWIQSQVKGATFREITLEKLRLLPVTLPPLHLQEKFARRIAVIEHLRSQFVASATNLNASFTSLQHRAFRGEL